ncbi:MAG: lysylphosphatidylglycerol synthase transmembrane domain-containing protein [Planctomycetota bacterium]
MKRWSVWLRLVVAVAGIGVIAWAIQWTDGYNESGEFVPGILTMLSQASFSRLGLAWLIAAPVIPLQGTRWWLLMRCQNLDVPWRRAQRLMWAGMFFNFCLPGSLGGDVVKAGFAVKGGPGKAAAVVSILVDRVLGLIGLVILASIAGLFVVGDPVAGPIARAAWVVLGVSVFSALLLLLPGPRDWLTALLSWLRLPGIGVVRKITNAVLAYHRSPLTVSLGVLISVLTQGLLTLSLVQCGYALGVTTSLDQLFVAGPVLLASAAIPLTPQGIGVMEVLAVALLVTDYGGASANQAVGMVVLHRFVLLSFGLLGAFSLLGGDIKLQELKAPRPAQSA